MTEIINQTTIPDISDLFINGNDVESSFTTFNNPEFTSFLIEYLQGIQEEVLNDPNVDLHIIDDTLAILSVKIKNFKETIKGIKNIVDVSLEGIYIPTEISPTDATKAYIFHNNPYLTLKGTNVLVGIIDSGIDYLNEEFINKDNTTRILSIWDQTEIDVSSKPKQLFGKEYNSNEINKAIKLFQEGGDPYTIVPHKDTLGHGTMVAGVLGGRGKDSELEGIAPDCTFAIVKLKPVVQEYADLFNLTATDWTYKSTNIILAIDYLNKLSIENNLPLAICIPLGNNLGARNGKNTLDRYIDSIANRRGLVLATSTGNEGNTSTHAQGILSKGIQRQSIELYIDEGQTKIAMSIYIAIPKGVQLVIVSPSGESTKPINSYTASSNTPLFEGIKNYFVYEQTTIYVTFYSPDKIIGDERIEIRAENLKPGIWTFRLQDNILSDVRYDAWIPNRVFLTGNTRFLNPIINTTLQALSTCKSIVATSHYNQNNYSVSVDSGRGFTRDDKIAPIVTAPGVNVAVTTPGGKKKIVSGGSIAAAVVSGVCALLLEWGIVKKNNETMRGENIKNYLIRGANRSASFIYPNPEWGYGIVDIEGIFNAIRNIEQTRGKKDIDIGEYRDNKEYIHEYYLNELFIRNPY